MRFSMYRCLIAIVILTGLFGYSVLEAEKKEAPVDRFIRLHNELTATYIELNSLMTSGLLKTGEGSNCAERYGEEKCKELFKSVSRVMFHQTRYDNILKKGN